MLVLLSPGHTYAVSSASGCTITQDGVDIVIDGSHGVFVSTATECTCSDDSAVIQFIF